MRLYAGDMNLNRKDEKKKYVEIQTFIVLENKTVKKNFLVKCFIVL